MNRFRISTPEGTRDLLFSSCRALRQTENAVRDALEERGYSEIITPAVEYFDVFAQANPELDQDQMLKIIDKSGRICVARPDNTTPIARIAATRLDDAALPVRLYYSQKVFRSVSGDHGHKGEFLQVGAEFIGADGLEADKDILSAAFAALSKTGADNFRVELGHAEIYKALMDELGADAQSAEGIRRLIENKSFAALGDALEPFKGKPAAKALGAMPNLFGGIEVLDEVEALTGNVRVLGATAYLRRLYKALDEAGYGDRIMIDKMVGKTEVALYGLAYSIGMLVQLFISGMNSALTPWMYSKIKKGDIRSMRKVLQLLSVVVVGIAVALMLISPELVLIFGSPKYREAVYVIPPVAASVFFIFIYNILSMPQFYYEKTQFLMAASMAAAGANVVLNFIFIRLFGYIAAGYTTLACYMLYSVGHYIVSKRILVNEGIQENLMNPGFLLACSVFLIGASIICNLIFPYRILRYAILLASAGLVFWKKELLLKTMADIRKK